MERISKTGVMFFVCACAITFAAVVHAKRGDYWLSGFTAVIAALEFLVAFSTTKPAKRRIGG